MKKTSYLTVRHWKEDLLASIVVFLVALPLSMGIAIASGVPLEKAAAVGLFTAAIAGIVNGTLSGCPLQVSGPAAGLAVMVALFVERFGFDNLGIIVLLAGLIQLAAGMLRLGPMFRAVSPALIQGMLAGIGVLIFAAQFHVMVDDLPPGTGKEFGGLINLWTLPKAIWKGVMETAHRPAALTGLLTIATIVLWAKWSPAKLKLIPPPLIGVIVGTAFAVILSLPAKTVPVPENLLSAIDWLHPLDFHLLGQAGIWWAAVSLAFVASAESLLTATAVDAMQNRTPRTRYSQELFAQGVGNTVAGILGLMPMTGVIVRSSANVMAGAYTRLSAILHGVWILVFVALLPDILRLIPVASLAAVLVYTGFKLMNPKVIRELWQTDRSEAGVYTATLVSVVAIDLLTGIVIGIVLALVKLLWSISRLEIVTHLDPRTKRAELHLKGAATFIRLPKLAAALEELPSDAKVHVYLHELSYIDHACLNLLVNWEQQHKAAGGELVIDWDTLHAVFQQHVWGNQAAAKAENQIDNDKIKALS